MYYDCTIIIIQILMGTFAALESLVRSCRLTPNIISMGLRLW